LAHYTASAQRLRELFPSSIDVSSDPFLTDDAVFAAIVDYETAVDCLNATVDQRDDDQLEECSRAYQTALDRMLDTAPTTRAGCVRLINAYLAALRDDIGPDDERLLELLAANIPHLT
jgi:hypothetical protein